MKRRNTVFISLALFAAVVFTALFWTWSWLANCSYSESSPRYSADHKFYFQMQFTLCKDLSRSHSQLIVGNEVTKEKYVLLEFGAKIGKVDVSWRDGPVLYVSTVNSSITNKYDEPTEDLPRVVIESR